MPLDAASTRISFKHDSSNLARRFSENPQVPHETYSISKHRTGKGPFALKIATPDDLAKAKSDLPGVGG
jgi:hypothetical protein